MKRLTFFENGHWWIRLNEGMYGGFPEVDRLAAYEDIGLEPEEIPSGKELAEIACALNELKAYKDTGLTPEEIKGLEYKLTGVMHFVDKWLDGKELEQDEVNRAYTMREKILQMIEKLETEVDHLKKFARAEKEGRLVVLHFPLHSVLVNMSNPEDPELMKDFRISATWTHRGIVFHSPWDIFSELVKSGSIKRVSQEAEAALKGGNEG